MGELLARIIERLAWTGAAAARSVYALVYHATIFMGPIIARLLGHMAVLAFSAVRFLIELATEGIFKSLENLFAGLGWLSGKPGCWVTLGVVVLVGGLLSFAPILIPVLLLILIVMAIMAYRSG